MEISAVYTTLFYISLLLFLAAVLRYILRRLDIPGIVADILAGITLSPYLLGAYINAVTGVEIAQINDYIRFMADFAVVLLIFAAGLEHGLTPLRAAGLWGALGAIFGALLPFLVGYLSYSPYLGRDPALLIGASLGATSLAAVVALLLERRVDNISSRFLTAAAAIDDVVTFVLLSAVLALISASSGSSSWLIFKIVSLYAIAWVAIFFLSLSLVKWLGKRIRDEYSYEFSLVVIFGLTVLMTLLGFSPIIAAFIAGVAIAEGMARESVKKMTESLLELMGPIFFVTIGAESDVRGLGLGGLLTALALTAIAVVFKMIGVLPFAYLYNRDLKASLAIAIGMIPRGETGLAIASLGFAMEILGRPEFTALVLMSLLTTIIGSIFSRRTLKWLR